MKHIDGCSISVDQGSPKVIMLVGDSQHIVIGSDVTHHIPMYIFTLIKGSAGTTVK